MEFYVHGVATDRAYERLEQVKTSGFVQWQQQARVHRRPYQEAWHDMLASGQPDRARIHPRQLAAKWGTEASHCHSDRGHQPHRDKLWDTPENLT